MVLNLRSLSIASDDTVIMAENDGNTNNPESVDSAVNLNSILVSNNLPCNDIISLDNNYLSNDI